MAHFFDESFIIAICFVIFVYLSYRPVRKVLVKSLDVRINEIKKRLAETEELRKDARLLLNEVKQEIELFKQSKESILEKANYRTQKLIKIRTKEIELALDLKRRLVITSINNRKEKISRQMHTEFTEAVLKMVKIYLIRTQNNAISDKEIIMHLFKNSL